MKLDRILYSDQIADEILWRLSEGESLRKVCKSGHLPDESTVRGWVRDNSHGDFAARFFRARSLGCDALADQILDIAEDGSRDIGPGGKVDWENVQRSKLRVDAIKWILSKMSPSKYGDKSALEISTPLDTPKPLSDEEKVAKLQALLDKARARKEAEEEDLM